MLIFNKYKIEKKIAQGGMGIIHKAHDSVLGRTVAIKELAFEGIISTEDKNNLIKRFKIEAETALLLNHQNIVRVFDSGEFDSKYFIVMEFLTGKNLKEYIVEKKSFTNDELVNIFIQICSGLEHAHNLNIIHRDIKPANIQIINEKITKITDFGIAKNSNSKSDLTQDGDMFGTLGYISPEQLKSTKYVDFRADLFSLGALMYECFTNKLPFESDTIANTIFKILMEKPPSIKELNPSISDKMESIIFKLLEKEPENRYQKSSDIVNDLKLCLSGSDNIIDLNNYASKNTNLVTKLALEEDVYSLTKGEKFILNSNKVYLGFNFNVIKNKDTEICILMLDKNDKLIKEEDFIFFNNTSSLDGSLKLDLAENKIFNSILEVDLNKTNDYVHKILIMISSLGEHTIKENKNIKFKLIQINENESTLDKTLIISEEELNNKLKDSIKPNKNLSGFIASETTTEKTLLLAEIYKHNSIWKFHVSEEGFNKNLEEMLYDYISPDIKIEK